MFKAFAFFALVATPVVPAFANTTAPVPPERPSVQFGEVNLSLGPGVNIDESGFRVECDVQVKFFNVTTGDGTHDIITVSCS